MRAIAVLLVSLMHVPVCASDSAVPAQPRTAASPQAPKEADRPPEATSPPPDRDDRKASPQRAPKSSSKRSPSSVPQMPQVDPGTDRQQPETDRLLVPDVMIEKKDQMSQKAKESIRKAEHLLVEIDQPRLTPQQKETLSTVQNFLSEAKQALSDKDVERALNLAGKAETLVNELPKVPQQKQTD